jgi:hypothetical protein
MACIANKGYSGAGRKVSGDAEHIVGNRHRLIHYDRHVFPAPWRFPARLVYAPHDLVAGSVLIARSRAETGRAHILGGIWVCQGEWDRDRRKGQSRHSARLTAWQAITVLTLYLGSKLDSNTGQLTHQNLVEKIGVFPAALLALSIII